MTSEQAKQAIEKRILYTTWLTSRSVSEATVKKVSPSGELVKLRYRNGMETWERVSDISLLEIL